MAMESPTPSARDTSRKTTSSPLRVVYRLLMDFAFNSGDKSHRPRKPFLLGCIEMQPEFLLGCIEMQPEFLLGCIEMQPEFLLGCIEMHPTETRKLGNTVPTSFRP